MTDRMQETPDLAEQVRTLKAELGKLNNLEA
jgi:hypothetical protein